MRIERSRRPWTDEALRRLTNPCRRYTAGFCWSLRARAGHSALSALVWWGAFHIGVATSTRHDLERFAALRVVAPPAGTPDQSLWSPVRVDAWRKAMSEPAPAPIAVLRIPKIGLEVPVLPGTDDRTLDRAVGHIEDTAQPGTDGNSGIAGHRDGFFRGLKDITPGDEIELDTLWGTDVYRVERTWVVKPEDVSVLDQTSTPTLTLVTCYPFYFVGSAPLRFIVRAARVGDKSARPPRSTAQVPCPSCGGWRIGKRFWSSHVLTNGRPERLVQRGALDDVFRFADVVGPLESLQPIHDSGWHLGDRAA